MLNLMSGVAYQVDLTNCDQEPIHIPGTIQGHGMLVVLKEPELEIIQISENVPLYFDDLNPEALLGASVEILFKNGYFESLKPLLENKDLQQNSTFLFEMTPHSGYPKIPLNIISHRIEGVLIIEMESASGSSWSNEQDLIHAIEDSLCRIRNTPDLNDFWQNSIHELKRISGFDRIMVYEFEPDGSGSVIAEVKEDYLETFLGLHYPASDIPNQARELYVKNKLRIIPNVDYEPVKLLPYMPLQTGQPLDMTYAILRGVSPIHIQYLQNMGVTATMTLSILKGGSLCGLIACHHYAPKYIPYDMRIACYILGQFINLEYLVRMEEKEYQYELRLLEMESRFIEFMSNSETIGDGLMNFNPNLGDFINAEGAMLYEGSVIYTEGNFKAVGLTPPKDKIQDLIDWLSSENKAAVYCTNELPKVFPPALAYKDLASGLLAITLSVTPPNYVLWFRPEKIETVNWAGDPSKSETYKQEGESLTPRASFEKWKETVRLKSLPWTSHEQLAAAKLREMILRVSFYKQEALITRNKYLKIQILQKTSDLAKSNSELEKFTLIASHDLQGPLRKLAQFSSFLKNSPNISPSGDEINYIERIQSTVHKMQVLTDNLLSLSRMSQFDKNISVVELRDIILMVLRELEPLVHSTQASIDIEHSISIECYPQKMHLLLRHLIENAIKFQKPNVKPVIKIGAFPFNENSCEIRIQDNGIGFDEKYLDRIFKNFERLNGTSAYEGSGIGLGIVRKAVEIHHGTITAKSSPDEGSTFIVRLPLKQKLSIPATNTFS
ncbi:ATP-binding protein [Vampirovibrio sp.]|uniref:ATP-binding protein n=1 Tax=Vampirovibrio sp. TaxID=2717857 RepID=UPI00359493B3